MRTRVYPTAPNSLNIKHPIDGALRAAGSDWELDGFTCRMLADGAVTETPPTANEKAITEKMSKADK